MTVYPWSRTWLKFWSNHEHKFPFNWDYYWILRLKITFVIELFFKIYLKKQIWINRTRKIITFTTKRLSNQSPSPLKRTFPQNLNFTSSIIRTRKKIFLSRSYSCFIQSTCVRGFFRILKSNVVLFFCKSNVLKDTRNKKKLTAEKNLACMYFY